jgi:hypothetical protein
LRWDFCTLFLKRRRGAALGAAKDATRKERIFGPRLNQIVLGNRDLNFLGRSGNMKIDSIAGKAGSRGKKKVDGELWMKPKKKARNVSLQDVYLCTAMCR